MRITVWFFALFSYHGYRVLTVITDMQIFEGIGFYGGDFNSAPNPFVIT